MRVLGFASAAAVVISFLFYTVSWVCFTFYGPQLYSAGLTKVIQAISLFGSLLEYFAILLAAGGLIIGAKHLRRTNEN